MIIKNYEELVVWQKAIELALLIYRFTSDFPKTELFGLVSQMRRAAVSVPSNIAEGWARKNTGEYINFLSISFGSLAELDTQLILSEKLNYGSQELRKQCFDLLTEIQKMLPAMMKSLESSRLH